MEWREDNDQPCAVEFVIKVTTKYPSPQVRFNDSSMRIGGFFGILRVSTPVSPYFSSLMSKGRENFQTGAASTVAGKRLSDRRSVESAAVAMPGSFWLIGQYSLLAPRGSCITQRDVEKLPDWDALINNPCAMCVPVCARAEGRSSTAFAFASKCRDVLRAQTNIPCVTS